jgi:hypothetical protein
MTKRRSVKATIREQFSITENDNSFFIGARSASQSKRDRFTYDREEVLQQALDAWRFNPLARRIIELTSQYVVGGGISITSKAKKVNQFINEFWNHRLNRMGVRIFEMCDELSRTGNLFLLISTDANGMSYIRVIPTTNIDRIVARENDIEQAVAFIPKQDLSDLSTKPYPAYDEQKDNISTPVMLQYTINKPSGAQWGESDLAPVLKWLARYSNWLEDRARLNRYRNAFLFTVSSKFASEVQRKARQQALNAEPPQPGSILVTDENEVWNVISPRLESRDAATDGMALKKMIASGTGIPMHFLAEPESATRTTAEAAGGPTYRRMQQRQEYFLWLLHDVLTVVLNRKGTIDETLKTNDKINPYKISITGTDINTADNITLAMAAGNILNVLTTTRDRNLIDDSEFLRLLYKFTGEAVDVEEMLKRGGENPALSEVNTLPSTQPPQDDGAPTKDSSPFTGGGKVGDDGTIDPHQLPPQAKGEKSKGIKK